MVVTLANYSRKTFKIILPQFFTFSMSRLDLMRRVVTKQQAELAKIMEQHKREMDEHKKEVDM